MFAFILFHLQTYGQTRQVVPNESDKCYARCLIQEYQEDNWGYRFAKPKAGYTESREVICMENMDSALINKIQRALITKGYSDDLKQANGEMTIATKGNIVKYQKDNELPVGQFDIETLNYLFHTDNIPNESLWDSINHYRIYGQGKEMESDKILLFELSNKSKPYFHEEGLSSLFKPHFPHLSYLTNAYKGYDIMVAFNKTESDSIFSNSKNIIRLTSFLQKRFNPSLVCSLNGDYRTWQLSSHFEIRKNGTQKSKYIFEEELSKYQIERIIEIFENEEILDISVPKQIYIEGTSFFELNPTTMEYLENLKNEFGINNIYIETGRYSCRGRCCPYGTKLVVVRDQSSDYVLNFVDVSTNKIFRTDISRNEQIERK